MLSSTSLINGNIFLLIELNSTSSILAVPAIVLNPSGAKNIKSPPISWIEFPLIQPIFLVTDLIIGVESRFVNSYILFLQNIINEFLNTLIPVIISPTSIDTAEAPSKSQGFNL